MADEQMNPELAERIRRRDERIKLARATSGLPPVRVVPVNDVMRRLLRHPSNNVGFPADGSVEWPNDQFTQMRLRDGDITLEEQPAGQPAEQPAQSFEDVQPKRSSSRGSAQGSTS